MLYGIIVTFRRPEDFRTSLAAIRRQTTVPDHLFVIDNDPSPENEAACRSGTAKPAIEYVACPDNLGPAGGFALGMRRVLDLAGDEDWVVLFDDDDPPHRDDLLQRMVEFGQRMRSEDPRTAGVGAFGARFSRALGRLVRPTQQGAAGSIEVDVIGNGRTPVYRVDVVRRVGPYDPRLFFGLEELEFGLRLRSAGYVLYANGDVWRQWIRSAGSPDGEGRLRIRRAGWRNYYAIRNLIWVQRAHGRLFGALFTTVVVALLKPLLNLGVDRARASEQLRLNVSAVKDAWSGRLGRTIEPPVTPE